MSSPPSIGISFFQAILSTVASFKFTPAMADYPASGKKHFQGQIACSSSSSAISTCSVTISAMFFTVATFLRSKYVFKSFPYES
jgi:hypothetical protein